MERRLATTLLLLLTLLAGPRAHAAEGECAFASELRKWLVIDPSATAPVTDPAILGKLRKDLPYSKLEYRVECFGKPGAGGNVYRIVPTKKEAASFVIKDMEQRAAARDLSAFQALREGLAGNPAFSLPSVKILKSSEPGRAYLQIQEARGRTLFDVLQDPKVPESAKDLLRKRYYEGMKPLEESLVGKLGMNAETDWPEAHYFPSVFGENELGSVSDDLLDGQPKMLRANQRWSHFFHPDARKPLLRKLNRYTDGGFEQGMDGQHLLFLLKSDNIIVTPDYRFMIIDPY